MAYALITFMSSLIVESPGQALVDLKFICCLTDIVTSNINYEENNLMT